VLTLPRVERLYLFQLPQCFIDNFLEFEGVRTTAGFRYYVQPGHRRFYAIHKDNDAKDTGTICTWMNAVKRERMPVLHSFYLFPCRFQGFCF